MYLKTISVLYLKTISLFLSDIIHGEAISEDFFKTGNELYCDDDDEEHNYLNLSQRSNWKPNFQIDWAIMCYGATGRDKELPLEALKSIYSQSAKNLRKAAPKLNEVEFWHSQTFDATNSTEEEIIHLFRSQFLRSTAEAELIANSATAQRFTVSKIVAQYLIQVRDCDHSDSARCNDPMGILRRAFRYLKPKISHFEAFLQRKLSGNVEFDFFATYLATVRNHRVFSGLMGSSFAQGEESFAQFELLRRIFSDDDKKLR
ncbi:unnamed protein product [Bursaphelenchus xylophilus]|uniref:(pine wood nematode) hypothetical protein n=1 Tax=Bursaphelenchus xylophilus TaxID=6326 RepID=A0A1I7S8J7_BURXY|nr:unnamed protein product [Bursaphelenchus xylophilus]CAG9089609.1 unnamed protein product [Bursaphelenchus xylophilus]